MVTRCGRGVQGVQGMGTRVEWTEEIEEEEEMKVETESG